MKQIIINFPVDVEITDKQLDVFVQGASAICDAYEKAHPDRVMWPASFGSKPTFSKRDAAFLGIQTSADAPEGGEPTFDDNIFEIGCCERERYEGEKS